MLFNSLEFAAFLPIVAVGYYVLPRASRWVLLLLASYLFYGWWEPWYTVLLLASSVLDWFVGRNLPSAPSLAARRRWLALSLLGNLGLLFTFKYFDLVNGTVRAGLASLGVAWPVPDLALPLPVGISFYTFQTLSYSIDVYRGRLEPERNLGKFALFVSFFPQLVAGPIERATALLPQLRRPGVAFDPVRAASGLRLAAWGLFKKVVVADNLAVLVNAIYDAPEEFGGFALSLATLFFAYQVYCDFSGYSDVAIGVARVFGVELMVNFDQPHGSRSMTEVWTRWHISLSTWFRDYLYVPLGGNRVSFGRWVLNTLLVFLVSGLWHGASWTFAIWGLAHGVLVIVDRVTRPLRDRVAAASGVERVPGLRPAIAISSTFLLWLLTLVPFRAESAQDVWTIYSHLGAGWARLGDAEALLLLLARVRVDLPIFVLCLALMPIVEAVDWWRRDPGRRARWSALPAWSRWGTDYVVIFSILLFGRWTDTPFVYFQF